MLIKVEYIVDSELNKQSENLNILTRLPKFKTIVHTKFVEVVHKSLRWGKISNGDLYFLLMEKFPSTNIVFQDAQILLEQGFVDIGTGGKLMWLSHPKVPKELKRELLIDIINTEVEDES